MLTIGFPISQKENERRRALLPDDLSTINCTKQFVFEEGYGDILGIDKAAYEEFGCTFGTKEQVLTCDVICDPKIGDANYVGHLKEGQMMFGWMHAVQNKELTDIMLENKLTAIAWEDMHDAGRHCFWRNNYIAGQASIVHAMTCFGIFPTGLHAAILGNGSTAHGAFDALTKFGAIPTIFNRKQEELFVKNAAHFDILVNAVLWDTSRIDHVMTISDLKNLKRDSVIVDISCDRNGAFESSHPTTVEDPIYDVHGIPHYSVDHTPTLFYRNASKAISNVVATFLDVLVQNMSLENNVLSDATIVRDGVIIDHRIITYQNR